MIDSDLEDDQEYTLEDEQSVDMYKISKPKVLQTNFYGQTAFQKKITIFRNQLNTAFKSAEEFGRFITMVQTNMSSQIEKAHESIARLTLGNFIGGKYSQSADIIHLLTEYNAKSGLSLTSETLYQPENYKPFMTWVSARIRGIMSFLTERTEMYHFNLEGKPIQRHTPYQNQKVYLYAPSVYEMESSVLSDLYNDKYAKLADHESVNFWQNPKSPDSLTVTPSYLDVTDGTIKTATEQELKNLFGVIFDEEAAGYTVVDNWTSTTPLNSAGGYWNIFLHFTNRYWNDFTENGVILMLD